jgi:hypothetical protein
MAAVSDLDPVMVGEPLWTLRKDSHSAEARVRAIPDYGELRFSIDGELYYSHRFTAWEPLEQAALEKRGDFEALVGSRPDPPFCLPPVADFTTSKI